MLSRREILELSGATAIFASLRAIAQDLTPPDYKLDIVAVTLDVSPRQQVKTTAHNGHAPGPLLHLKEGQAVTIEVTNHTDHAEVVHWHGLFLPPAIDGALEEGAPPIAARASARYTFTPAPAGFRSVPLTCHGNG